MMSSSKSNVSNQSSRSNILTLSQDSQSSQLKSHRVNLYYKKFISKLGFLFRIDTQDLDALYNKIAECVEGSDSFVRSSDVNINELIQMAKQLKHNHCLLKNMVEVLDHRFLKKSSQSQDNASIRLARQEDSIQQNHDQRKNRYRQTNSKNENSLTQDLFIGLFNESLEKTKEETRKRRQLEQTKIVQTTNFQNELASNQQRKPLNDRVRKIFQQMKSIKGDLKKIQKIQHNSFQQIQSINQSQTSLIVDQPPSTQKITSSIILPQNKVEDDGHQVFTQIQPDTYYLQDDRFSYLPELPQSHSKIPKLSLKEIYNSMGVDPNNQTYEREVEDNEMGVIRETSRQSGSLNEIQNGCDKELSLISTKNNQQRLLQNLEDEIKGKSINNSTSLGNLTQKSECSTEKKTQIDRQVKQRNILSRYEYIEERESEANIPQASSEQSQSVSNVTIIQKLNFGEKCKKDGISVLEQSFYNVNPSGSMKKKENSVYYEYESQGDRQKIEAKKDIKDFREDLKARNEKSKQKINKYILKLEQRNKILQSYITDIEKNLTHEEEQKFQNRTLQSNRNASKSLSNLVYTGNEIMNFKYAPVQNDPNNQNSFNFNTLSRKSIKNQQSGTKSQKNYKNDNLISQSDKNEISLNTKMPVLLPKLSLGNEVDQQMEPLKKINDKRSQLKNNLYLVLSDSDRSSQRSSRNSDGSGLQNALTKQRTDTKDGQKRFQMPNFCQKNSNKQNKKDRANIDLSKISMNSLEERLEKEHSQSENKSSQQFTIPRVTNTSLFEQTRNAESKLDLSEDRGYRPRVVGEQIQRIKGSVNQLFKKIKSITNESPLAQSQSDLERKKSEKMQIQPRLKIIAYSSKVQNNSPSIPKSDQVFHSKIQPCKIPSISPNFQLTVNPYMKDLSIKNSRNSSHENKQARGTMHRVIFLNNSRDSNFSFQNPINKMVTSSHELSSSKFNNTFNFSRSSSNESLQTKKNLTPARPIVNFGVPSTRSSSNQSKNGQQIKIHPNSTYIRSPGCSPPLPPKFIYESNKFSYPPMALKTPNPKYFPIVNSQQRQPNSTMNIMDQRKYINDRIVLAESEVMKYRSPGIAIKEKAFLKPERAVGQVRVQRIVLEKSSSRGSRDSSKSNRKKGINIVSRKNN